MNDKRPYWFLGTTLWGGGGGGKAGRRVLLSCAPGRYSIAPCPSSSREVRRGDQSQDREDAQLDDPTIGARARGRSSEPAASRLKPVFFHGRVFATLSTASVPRISRGRAHG